MTIELHINGKLAKHWFGVYRLGPYPIQEWKMADKELQLKQKVRELKFECESLIFGHDYEIYVTVKSKLNPENISQEEYFRFVTALPECIKKRPVQQFEEIY